MATECPVCTMYDRVAVAAALLEDLTGPAMQHGGAPPGLGGTIPQARQRLVEADDLLHHAVMPLTGWDLRQFDAMLEQCITALDVWLTPPAIATVAAMTRECRRQAYAVAGAWWVQHPPAPQVAV